MLNEADAMWRSSQENDYTTKATARSMAVAARRSYNPNYVDDFDYTFGTGASAVDNGATGTFIKTVSAISTDNKFSALAVIVYSRYSEKNSNYIQLNKAYGYSTGSRDNGIYAVSTGGIVGAVSVLGSMSTTFKNESSVFNVQPAFNRKIADDSVGQLTTVGVYVDFYFTMNNGVVRMSISNNIYDEYYIDEKGLTHYADALPYNITEGRVSNGR